MSRTTRVPYADKLRLTEDESVAGSLAAQRSSSKSRYEVFHLMINSESDYVIHMSVILG